MVGHQIRQDYVALKFGCVMLETYRGVTTAGTLSGGIRIPRLVLLTLYLKAELRAIAHLELFSARLSRASRQCRWFGMSAYSQTDLVYHDDAA